MELTVLVAVAVGLSAFVAMVVYLGHSADSIARRPLPPLKPVDDALPPHHYSIGDAPADAEADDSEPASEYSYNQVTSLYGAQDWSHQLRDADVALLIYFHQENNEVCAEQSPDMDAAALRYANVRFLSADCNMDANVPLLQFYGVNHAPTFVLRRRGEVKYHKISGRLFPADLDAFIKQSLEVRAE